MPVCSIGRLTNGHAIRTRTGITLHVETGRWSYVRARKYARTNGYRVV
jgi:hypothetical protein